MPEQQSDFIHRYIASARSEAATLLLLHGTGGNEDDLIELGRVLAPHANILSPRGKVDENGMNRFFRRLAEGVFDIDDLIFRTHELTAFVAAAAQEYGFDNRKIIAAGYSNGANIAAAMLLLRPGTLRAAALFHPMVPLVPESLPDLSATPVFIGAGRSDPLIPAPETERLITLLQQGGAHVTAHWQPGGHNLNRSEIAAAKEWLINNDLG